MTAIVEGGGCSCHVHATQRDRNTGTDRNTHTYAQTHTHTYAHRHITYEGVGFFRSSLGLSLRGRVLSVSAKQLLLRGVGSRHLLCWVSIRIKRRLLFHTITYKRCAAKQSKRAKPKKNQKKKKKKKKKKNGEMDEKKSMRADDLLLRVIHKPESTW